jgi:hypothetical protein
VPVPLALAIILQYFGIINHGELPACLIGQPA